MAPRYRRIAVIGAGPSGLAAVRALSQEKSFDVIRVFERRDRVGGLWHFDPEPDQFPSSLTPIRKLESPQSFPSFENPAPADPTARTALYPGLDSNVGANVMAFTHIPFPEANSALSVNRFGPNNPTRPYEVVAGWIEDLFRPYLHLVSLSTTVEKIEKKDNEWVVTLRKTDLLYRGKPKDYWWQEKFDAIIVASGHYNVGKIPSIKGIEETAKAFPGAFEHSKAYRGPNKFVNKKVLIVGGNVSASDLIADLHDIVKGKLYVSMRGRNERLDALYKLPNVEVRKPVESVYSGNGIAVRFTDGSIVDGFEHILFATGFRLSYPFLKPDPITETNRLARFYRHVFSIDQPSLAVVGQVRGAISFRVYEYQAVAVARYFAGHESKALPSVEEQRQWELERLKYKGDSDRFHEIAPDLEEYFSWFHEFAGKPAQGTDAYELPPWHPNWEKLGLEVLGLKDKYYKEVIKRNELSIQAKL